MTGAREPIALFGLGWDAALVERVAHLLGVPRAAVEERDFEDGEHKARPLESVRGRDVYLLTSLHAEPSASVDDKLVRALFLLGALRDAGAARLTVAAPYLCYARKDRRTQPRDPITTRYVATLFEAVGVDRFVGLDVHDLAAFENAFRIPTVHLEAADALIDALLTDPGSGLAGVRGVGAREEVVVVSPDPGGVKRADRFRARLEARLARPVGFAVMEKHRSGGQVRSGALVGDVAGRVAILVDDLVASGTTLVRAGQACLAHAATRVLAAVTHAVYTEAALATLATDTLARIWITDSVPPSRYPPAWVARRFAVVDCAPLFAALLQRLRA